MRRAWPVLCAVLAVACAGGGDDGLSDFTEPGSGPTASSSAASPASTGVTAPGGVTASSAPGVAADAEVVVEVDVDAPGATISPLILGVSGDLSVAAMRDAGITLDSWGGNPASRFNYEHGFAWNAAADWEFRNTSYGWTSDAFRAFTDTNEAAGVETRVVVPTLGWVARDGDDRVCSFPTDGGGCLTGADVDCEDGGPVADPARTSVRSTPEMVAAWIAELLGEGRDLRFIAMDNEPDLWGHTHYDVHPACPTFQEIVDTYVEYATAIRAVAPDAELMGPAMCCWYDYWNIDPGPPDGSDTDFLTWFLTQVREHDERTGVRTLDVVDVHFYPQTGVFNDDTDEETNARRLRSTRALWDPTYVDESWINKPIAFLPRMRRIIEASYPGTPLAVSEWNFGADGTMNGALAIADTLGTFGAEGVYAAAYWRSPREGSPGYQAFKLFGNYDGAGSRFGGQVVAAASSDRGAVSAYGAIDGGTLKLVLVNKADEALDVGLVLGGQASPTVRRRFRYGADEPGAIVQVEPGGPGALGVVTVPGSTLELLEIDLGG